MIVLDVKMQEKGTDVIIQQYIEIRYARESLNILAYGR